MSVNLDLYFKNFTSYALKEGFIASIDKNKIDIFPLLIESNPLLVLLFELKDDKVIFEIRKHSFLHINDEKNAWGKKVSAGWVKKYFHHRAFDSAKLTAHFIKENKGGYQYKKYRKVLEKIEGRFPSLKLYKNKENIYQYSITNPYDSVDAGPLNDDWDASDWESYMGGPDY